MVRTGFSLLYRLLRSRRLVQSLSLCGLLTLGCAQFPASSQVSPEPLARGANPAANSREAPTRTPTHLPPATMVTRQPSVAKTGTPVTMTFQEGPPAKQVPVNLDTVLRLAQDHNTRVRIAREKVQEACAGRDLADKAWLPDLWVGTSFYRHEGGIQNEDGSAVHSSFGALFAGVELRGRLDLREAVYQKVDAERKLWQQKGELARVTNEQLLDAANTYVDLLAAKAGEAISLSQEDFLNQLLAKTAGLAKVDPGLDVEVMRVQSEMASQQQMTRKLREGYKSGSAKLAYLLGIDPMTDLVLMDRQFAAFSLVDPTTPVGDLVALALASGPGVREVEGLLNLIQEANQRNQGFAKYLPVFEIKAAEGAFGAGPGSRSDWDNRFDTVISVKWNLTDWLTQKERQRLTQTKMTQLNLSHQDLQGRLTVGVQEAHEAIQSGQEQMPVAENQIRHAKNAYERSKVRLEKTIKGSSPSEVLFAIRSLGGAQLGYLSAIRDYDKAQLRLLLLLGEGPSCGSRP